MFDPPHRSFHNMHRDPELNTNHYEDAELHWAQLVVLGAAVMVVIIVVVLFIIDFL